MLPNIYVSSTPSAAYHTCTYSKALNFVCLVKHIVRYIIEILKFNMIYDISGLLWSLICHRIASIASS